MQSTAPPVSQAASSAAGTAHPLGVLPTLSTTDDDEAAGALEEAMQVDVEPDLEPSLPATRRATVHMRRPRLARTALNDTLSNIHRMQWLRTGTQSRRSLPRVEPPRHDSANLSRVEVVSAEEGRESSSACDLSSTPAPGEVEPAFLPTPIRGFPVVHKAFPSALTRNIDPRQLQDWLSYPSSTSSAIQVYDATCPTREEAYVLMAKIRGVLAKFTGCSAVKVSSPIGVRDFDGQLSYPSPSTFFICKLSEPVATRLKEQVCWSTKTLAFFAYDLRPSIPQFLFGLQGFTRADAQQLESIVKQAMMQPKYRDLTLSFAVGNSDFSGLSRDVIFDTLLRSVHVKVTKSSSGALVANVYGRSPTKSAEQWCLWRNALSEVEYYDSFIQIGTSISSRECSGCHGADHIRMHCPFFKEVLGWHGADRAWASRGG
ncbi:hypothetical protein OH77DRAFT_1431807 [Trametes cingulata]|nr:hypothetical protein OH77DRAFT_1431807 [Trametes cingulata]